jgi:prepilin-type N-terminal cleavage/methylation domain-containing protein
MTKKMGFTLAEVLITLGIIGVVAAMTIPTLMNQTGTSEFKTGFKKMLSTLNQAATMNVALNSSDFSNLTSTTTAGSIYEMFTTRMNVVASDQVANTTLDPSGVAVPISAAANYTLFFNDGMAIGWLKSNASCTAAGTACDAIVDVNGLRGPNRLTNCGTSTTATDTTACTTANILTADRFSVRFAGQGVYPNGAGARFIMYN